MPDENEILKREAEIVRSLQRTIRNQLDQRGFSLKAAGYDSGIGYTTLVSYFTNAKDAKPSALTVAALRRLVGVLPTELLSILLPDGFHIVRAPEGIDHDRLAELMAEYLAAKNAAHHPDSEAGREIGPGEDAVLTGKLVQLRAAA